MNVHLNTRSRCDECDRPASVEVEPDCFLCDDCVAIVCAVLSSSCGRLDPGAPSIDADTGIAGPQDSDPSSCGGVKESPASIPEYNGVKSPALLTAHGLSGKSCPLSRSEIGPQDSLLNFAAEVSTLEAQWLRAGIIMNASTLRTVAPSRMASNDISKSVSVGE